MKDISDFLSWHHNPIELDLSDHYDDGAVAEQVLYSLITNKKLDQHLDDLKKFEGAMERDAPAAAVIYAVKVLDGRFEEAEPSIARATEPSLTYARRIMKGRFPEAESQLVQLTAGKADESYGWKYYNEHKEHFKDGDWPEFEDYFYRIAKLAERDSSYISKLSPMAVNYGINRGRRFRNGEPYILRYAKRDMQGLGGLSMDNKFRGVSNAIKYAEKVIKGRWPELEQIVNESPEQLQKLRTLEVATINRLYSFTGREMIDADAWGDV